MTAHIPPAAPFEADDFEPMNAPWLFDDDRSQTGSVAEPARKERKSKILSVLSGLLIAGTFAGSLYLGIRLDNQNLDPEPASASEIARQELAVLATRIANHAKTIGTGTPTAADIAAHAETWTARLGGVWIPWPDGNTPSGHTNPPLATDPPKADPSSLLSDLDNFSSAAISDSASRTGAERESLAAIALDAKILAARLATASGLHVPAAGTLDLPAVATTLDSSESLDRLAQARQWLERDASLIAPEARSDVESRIETITSLEDEMLQAGIADKRAAVAQYPKLADNESLTMMALDQLTDMLLEASRAAGPEQTRAIVDYLYSLYQTDTERAQAHILD